MAERPMKAALLLALVLTACGGDESAIEHHVQTAEARQAPVEATLIQRYPTEEQFEADYRAMLKQQALQHDEERERLRMQWGR